MAMEIEILGWPGDGVSLQLDYRRFSYAGKFVMSTTGKSVGRKSGNIVAAASFSEDRSDEETMWIRYLTVRDDKRGEGYGSELAADTTRRIECKNYSQVKIAVNNPYALKALTKAGFGFTGQSTGIAELVLSTNINPADQYQSALRHFKEYSHLSSSEQEFIRDEMNDIEQLGGAQSYLGDTPSP